jgi:prolyl oligopeptidase PreP (S9A serine peptidase family)
LPIDLPCPASSAIVPVVSDDGQWLIVAAFDQGSPGCRVLASANNGSFTEVEELRCEELGLGWWRPEGPVLLKRDFGQTGRDVVLADLTSLRSGGGRPRVERLHTDTEGLLAGVVASPGGALLTIRRAIDGGDDLGALGPEGAIERIGMPEPIAVSEWAYDGSRDRVLLRVEQWDAPARLLAYDFGSRAIECLSGSVRALDLEVLVRTLAAEGGASVPVTVIRRAGLNRPAPCLLYGYGGFGISPRPQSMLGLAPWLEAGGIVVAAHVRGGGERGPTWHEDGRGLNKRNSFRDFIATARWLVSEGLARAGGVCSWGQSAGGLLALGAAVLAPRQFAGVVAVNPVTDGARFAHYGDDGAHWIAEFGDPANDPAALASAAEWSPLHNLVKGCHYPPTLIIVGANDTRVSPAHGRKMTAALHATGSCGPHLHHERPDTGHGGRATLGAHIDDLIITQRFAAAMTGLEL